MLIEAKKAKPKKKESKPKVEKPVQDTVDPTTGQEVEVTKPAKAMTGNPANPIVVYPNRDGMASVVDPRNPMRNSQTALLQSHTEKKGLLLNEYIDYARGKVVQGIGQSDIPKAPSQGDNGNDPINADHSGDVGHDEKTPEGKGGFGSPDERVRRRAGKRNSYHDGMPGVWGGDADDYVSEDAGDDFIRDLSILGPADADAREAAKAAKYKAKVGDRVRTYAGKGTVRRSTEYGVSVKMDNPEMGDYNGELHFFHGDVNSLKEAVANAKMIGLITEAFSYPPAPEHFAPPGAEWVHTSTLPAPERVRAKLHKQDGVLKTEHGDLKISAGDVLVTSKEGHQWPVRADIFKSTYRKHMDGSWSKRPGLQMHGYIAPHDHDVPTLEGKARAKKGDLVLRGTAGEWWPQNYEKAAKKYKITPVR